MVDAKQFAAYRARDNMQCKSLKSLGTGPCTYPANIFNFSQMMLGCKGGWSSLVYDESLVHMPCRIAL